MDVEFVRHQFEDRKDGVVTRNKFKLGVRHIQVIYMFLCAASLGALRGSTGIAVLALTDVSRKNDSYIHIYDWDAKVQGGILSSYLFGYAAMLVPAELLLRKIGGKHIMTAVLVFTGALSMAMPTIVRKGGWIALCNAHLWLGAVQACLVPSNQSLLVKFLPPSERGFLSCLVHSGTLIGVIIGLPISAVISQSRLSWQLVFYSQAMTAISMACLWGLLTASTPEQHQAMGDTEKEFIKESQSSYRRKVLHIPWRSILRSRQVWAVTSAHIASNVVFVFFMFYIPVFLFGSGNDIQTCGWQTIISFATFWLIRMTTSSTIDWFLRILRMGFQIKISYIRKLINLIGAGGVVTGLLVLPNLSSDWSGLVIFVLAVTLGVMGLQLSGFLDAYRDMSDNYNGTLLMISRTVASFVTAFVPFMIGFIFNKEIYQLKHWRMVFHMIAGIYMICNAIYTIFGSSDRQYWDGIVVKNKFGYHNAMIDTNHLELEEFNDLKKSNDDGIINSDI